MNTPKKYQHLIGKRIAFVNDKGGAGKTTCAMLTGMAFVDAGVPVCIEDRVEVHGTARSWAGVAGGFVPHGTPALTVIDTPARGESDDLRLPKADLYVIPLQVASYDIVVSVKTYAAIRAHSPKATIRLLFNDLRSKAEYRAISDIIEVPDFGIRRQDVLQSVLFSRQVYRHSQQSGWAALTIKDAEKALLEVAALRSELSQTLKA